MKTGCLTLDLEKTKDQDQEANIKSTEVDQEVIKKKVLKNHMIYKLSLN